MLYADRVKETTTTTGTGTVTLGGAASQFQAFSVFPDGAQIAYAIVGQSGTEWETGVGTYTLSGTTLARTFPQDGSAGAGVLVTFSAGTKDVFCTVIGASVVDRGQAIAIAARNYL